MQLVNQALKNILLFYTFSENGYQVVDAENQC